MRVLLARHSLAVDAGLADLDDEQRYLTLRGRARARAVGAALLARGDLELGTILTSPLTRAVQTAELLAQALGFGGDVVTLPALAPGYPPRLVLEQLAVHAGDLLLVGHEPSITSLGALLVQRPSFPPFRPGQIACIERGEPRWWLHPETLESLPLHLH